MSWSCTRWSPTIAGSAARSAPHGRRRHRSKPRSARSSRGQGAELPAGARVGHRRDPREGPNLLPLPCHEGRPPPPGAAARAHEGRCRVGLAEVALHRCHPGQLTVGHHRRGGSAVSSVDDTTQPGRSIPRLGDHADTLQAAVAYAAAGLYVLPVGPGTKSPGSIVGGGWPSKSSTETKVPVSWFAGTDAAIAIHAGRSGLVAFDVDPPEKVPPVLAEVIAATSPPFQSTRDNDPRRGHYVFRVPPARSVGNRTGGLGVGWGEVRGANGVIVVAPSAH